MPRNVRDLFAVAAAMTLVTLVVLAPQVRHLDFVPEHTDPIFSIWRLAWIAHQLPADPAHLYDANIFWPERYTLANSDAMLLTGVAASPLMWLGIPAVVVYNLLLLASFVLSGVTMFWLVRSLTGNTAASFVSGLAFAFFPFRLEHYVHLELLSAFWMPVALWALHRVIGGARPVRDGILLGLLVAAQYHSSIYFGIYLATYLVVVGGVLFFSASRLKTSLRALAVAALVGSALIAVSLPPYLHVRQSIGDRKIEEVEYFSAKPADYLSRHQPDRMPDEVNERQLFPGLVVLTLAFIGLWPLNTAVRWAYLGGLLLAFDMSLGSHGLLHPFLFEWFVPFRGLRAPARFGMLTGLSLSVLAGFGIARLVSFTPRRWPQVALAAALSGLILFEVWPSPKLKPLRPIHPVYTWLQQNPVHAAIEVPVTYEDGPKYLLPSTTHWRSMANGSSGSYPKSYRYIRGLMRKFPDPESLAELLSRDVSHVVVHEQFMGTPVYKAMVARIEATGALWQVHVASDGRNEARIYKLGR